MITLCVLASPADVQVRIEIVDLGVETLNPYGPSASGINNRGAVAGQLGGFAFVWTPTRGRRLIEFKAKAVDINDAGQVVGWWDCDIPDDDCPLGFLWSETGGFVDLGSFRPYSINAKGDMVGTNGLHATFRIDGVVTPTSIVGPGTGINARREASAGAHGYPNALVVTPPGQVFALDTFGFLQTFAYDINDNGTVVGIGDLGDRTVAMMWKGDGVLTADVMGSEARAVNNRDIAAGFFHLDGRRTHAMMWDPARGVIDLGTLAGPSGSSYAFGINDVNEIVGISTGKDGLLHAVKWKVLPSSPLSIETPNAPSRWGLNTRQRLTWTYAGDVAQFLIEISRNSGVSWEHLATVPNATGNSQNFDWRVTGPLTSAAKFRVSAIDDPEATDINDVDIRIANATIEVLSPTETTSVAVGSPFTLHYRHSLGARAPVIIEVSADNGNAWQTISETTTTGSTTSSFKWTASLLPTTRARLRIRALDGSGAKATSRAFSVRAMAR